MNKSPITRSYKKALLPNILIVLGGTINVFFDGILVGQKLGHLGLDAINQCLPFYLILCTIGSLIASGVANKSAFCLGNNDLNESKRFYQVGLFLSIIFSFFIMIISLIFLNPLALLFSNSNTYLYVKDYLKITIFSTLFKILIYNFTFYLRIEGKLIRSSISMFSMTFLNILLDFIFLFVFDFKVKGAALASLIATFIATFLCFIFLYTDKSNYALLPKIPKKDDYLTILKLGSSMSLNNLTSSLRVFILNQLFKMSTDASLISIFAIINNVNEFSMCIQNGVPQSASAMEGILYGAKEYKTLKNLVKTQIKSGLLISGIIALILLSFSRYIPLAFGSDINCNFAILAFLISFIFATINSVYIYFYNSTYKVIHADIITLLKGLIYPCLFALILSKNTTLIWLFYPISELITLLSFIILSKFKKDKNLSNIYLLDENFEKEANIYEVLVDGNSNDISNASLNVSGFCEKYELSSKKSMAISLAIEEILMIISTKSLANNAKIDVRVLKNKDDIIIRFRASGKYYNPFKMNDNSLDYLGVNLISKMAKKIDYQRALGLNTLIIAM